MALRSRSVLVAGFLLVAAVCARLGIWQVHRLQERRAANALAQAGRAAPAVQVDSFGLDSSLIDRRVVVRGRYDHEHDIVLRGRGYSGVPGVEIVSPLLQQSGVAVLVNRGFVPAPDAVTVDRSTLEELGPVTVEGHCPSIRLGRRRSVQTGQRNDLGPARSQSHFPVASLPDRAAVRPADARQRSTPFPPKARSAAAGRWPAPQLRHSVVRVLDHRPGLRGDHGRQALGRTPSSSSIVFVDGCRVFRRRAAVASAPRKARSRFPPASFLRSASLQPRRMSSAKS